MDLHPRFDVQHGSVPRSDSIQLEHEQAAFVNWEEAFIELPIRLMIANGSGAAVTSTQAATFDQLIPKAGVWQWLDSVQVVIDGTTVQTNQSFENVNATFKALTETDYNDYIKRGTSSNFVVDQLEAPVPGTTAIQALENLPTASFLNTNVGEFGMANTFINKGAAERSYFTSAASTGLVADIHGSAANLAAVGRHQVYVVPAGSVGAGALFYAAHYLVVIKFADVCDYFKKCPMQKNTKGFIYLNYNSSLTTRVTGQAGTVTPAGSGISTLSTNMSFGNTCPIMWNWSSATATSAGAVTDLAVPSGTTHIVSAHVNGVSAPGSGLNPSQQFSRLLVPTYSPNPGADHALSQKKSFRYFERITNSFIVNPNQSFTVTVSNGIANPKKLILQPILQTTRRAPRLHRPLTCRVHYSQLVPRQPALLSV